MASEWSGYVVAEYRYFSEESLSADQHDSYVSVSAQPEWFHQWDRGKQSFAFVPFIREDQYDDERSHVDIRELTWLKAAEDWELRIGIRKVFWGVTESQHLVDIINQTDLVENIDGEDKLGQPMVNLALINDWGTLDLFVLPYFRERTFPGVEGRLRTTPYVDTDNAQYESDKKEQHVDYALRWKHYIGDWDFGLSHFYGTSRDPRFVLNPVPEPVFVPYYELIHQTGLDVQATLGAWLWKLEVIRRSSDLESYSAATGGFEYTFYGVMESAADIGLVMEYLYDDRGQLASTPFQDDLMLGVRLTLNDESSTEALVGVIDDRDSRARMYSIEASRRFGNHWKMSLEGRWFDNIPDTDPLYSYKNDDVIQLEIAYYF
ncbi:MAG: hypothetical protein P8Y24_12820 [Gammaproteobacteria bacterium]